MKDTTLGITGELVVGSGIHVISPTPFDGDWTQMTLLVVPKSIPATVARPRNPILAMIMTASTMIPIRDGSMASIPPDLESSACLLAILDRFFFFIMRLLEEDEDCVEYDVAVLLLLMLNDSSFDHSFCRSRFLLRLSCGDEDGAVTALLSASLLPLDGEGA